MPPAFNLSQDQTLQFNTCFGSFKNLVLLKENHLHDLFSTLRKYYIFLKSFPRPIDHENFPKTKHLHSSVVRLFFKELADGLRGQDLNL